MLRSNEELLCLLLSLSKSDHYRDLHHNHNSSRLLNNKLLNKLLSKNQRNTILHLSKCSSL